jgi:DNA-directed RNA polymerase
LEKTRKKKLDKGKKKETVESTKVIKEEEKLRKKVIDLMKKQKLVAVKGLMKGLDDTKPWGPVMKTKVYIVSSTLEMFVLLFIYLFLNNNN